MSSRGRKGEEPALKRPATEPEPDDPQRDDAIEIVEVVGVDEDTGIAPVETNGPEPSASPAPVEPPFPGETTALQDAVREKDRYYDLLLRKQAELDNFRKRSAKERGEAGAVAAAELLRVILPVLDNLHRALRTSEGSDNPLRQGIVMIEQQLLEVLKKEGLKPLETNGATFDPHLHEAVEVVDVAGREQGVILEEMRRGYVFNGKLLRPALVRVSSGRDPEAGDGGSGQTART